MSSSGTIEIHRLREFEMFSNRAIMITQKLKCAISHRRRGKSTDKSPIIRSPARRGFRAHFKPRNRCVPRMGRVPMYKYHYS